ncbi:hypothetical protein K2X14_14475 [Acetobacter sp. TBRC 12305]|uniref:Uncharacterized protein n=1 Tax=Acetobacter garciniae TaxID=2817435 RepID=A0A939HME2_9PROT|nr:hypothetical protein [Acetobacter garciniae]MBO1326222.1 hypothetical protein [Acetobacter garciniae]MBX0346041.1 hypothetical protein [Acetobacter garciniae]
MSCEDLRVRVSCHGPGPDRAALRDQIRREIGDGDRCHLPPMGGLWTTRSALGFQAEQYHEDFYQPLLTRLSARFRHLTFEVFSAMCCDHAAIDPTVLEIWQGGACRGHGTFSPVAFMAVQSVPRLRRWPDAGTLYTIDPGIAALWPRLRPPPWLRHVGRRAPDIGAWRILEGFDVACPERLYNPVAGIVLIAGPQACRVISGVDVYGRVAGETTRPYGEICRDFPELARWCDMWVAHNRRAARAGRRAAARYNRHIVRMRALYGEDWDAIPF